MMRSSWRFLTAAIGGLYGLVVSYLFLITIFLGISEAQVGLAIKDLFLESDVSDVLLVSTAAVWNPIALVVSWRHSGRAALMGAIHGGLLAGLVGLSLSGSHALGQALVLMTAGAAQLGLSLTYRGWPPIDNSGDLVDALPLQ